MIGKNYYEKPTQVVFFEVTGPNLDDVIENMGIAYKNEIICSCCGSVFELDDDEVDAVYPLSWVNFSDTIKVEKGLDYLDFLDEVYETYGIEDEDEDEDEIDGWFPDESEIDGWFTDQED